MNFKGVRGGGPRHFVFSSDGTKMYVINEINSTISVFNVDANGELKLIQTLTTLKEGFKGRNSCADIHIGKNGKFLYGSNRGENTIVTFVFKLNKTTGLPVEPGKRFKATMPACLKFVEN